MRCPLPTALSLALLAGCSTWSPPPPSEPSARADAAWHPVAVPGKTATQYQPTFKAGRAAIAADANRSASLWRRKLDVTPDRLGEVRFSWWVQDLPAGASVADVEREDAGARLLFGFAGDTRGLPLRTRMLFDLAEALSGERPPYATLMYVWDAQAPVGSVIVNPRSDRIRKIVVDSGTASLGRWREHRRDLRADFKRAFGEDPGALVSVALMTDSDNTASRARAWYGDVVVQGSAESAVARP